MDKKALRRKFGHYASAGVMALMLNSVYVVVDGLFVARLIGRDALAAVTVAVPVVEILVALSMLISVGGGVIIAQSRGRKDDSTARKAFMHSAGILLAVAVAVAFLGVVFRGPLARWMGATDVILPMVMDYFFWIFLFSPFFLFSYALCTWVRNDDRPRLALVAMGVGAVVNIVLDYVLIAWAKMGVGGAALATGLGPVVSCAILLTHFLRRKGVLYPQHTRWDWSMAGRVLVMGAPSFLLEFSLGMATLLVNLAMGPVGGELGLAAFGVVGYVALIALSIFLGMAEGTQPLLSFYHGKGDVASGGYLRNLSLATAGICGIVAYAVIYFGAGGPARLFGGQDAALVDMAIHGMRLYFPALFAAGMNIQAASAMQSVGRWKPSAAVSLLRSLAVLQLMLWLLPGPMGLDGVWLSVAAAEIITLPCAVLFMRRAKAAPERRLEKA